MRIDQIKLQQAVEALQAFVRSPLAHASPSRESVQDALDALTILSAEVLRLGFIVNLRDVTPEELKAAADGVRMIQTGDPLSPEERAAMEGTQAPEPSVIPPYDPTADDANRAGRVEYGIFPDGSIGANTVENSQKPESD